MNEDIPILDKLSMLLINDLECSFEENDDYVDAIKISFNLNNDTKSLIRFLEHFPKYEVELKVEFKDLPIGAEFYNNKGNNYIKLNNSLALKLREEDKITKLIHIASLPELLTSFSEEDKVYYYLEKQ